MMRLGAGKPHYPQKETERRGMFKYLDKYFPDNQISLLIEDAFSFAASRTRPNETLPPSNETSEENLLRFRIQALNAVITDKNARIAELEKMTVTDSLTGVLNRRGFHKELERAVAGAKRYQESGMLILTDLNNFKKINDTYGHAAGDRALTHFTHFMEGRLRATDIIGRLGGDEFAFILPRCDAKQFYPRLATTVKALAETPFLYDNEKIYLSVSVGEAIFTGTENAETLLKEADIKMYLNKKGENPFRLKGHKIYV